MEETISAFSNREIHDELKKKYGDSLVSIRKVGDYEWLPWTSWSSY